eukprot:CAMPEP_0201216562 /NCGR_PEP_ID=MMETSP0851-20130426/189581_1 /ASSEMBLY_ACC=CAM_ASM_000631 /TAXON_ID=183588 /ORGANISM="Pseudo-nitzschia fraudulenta, Strain WWA7" /LENGTH=495 /DNA_ID=CAMNT_0047506145 /DNA_START=632 /DNA_END=2121 /DNA_ORIENTATION=+
MDDPVEDPSTDQREPIKAEDGTAAAAPNADGAATNEKNDDDDGNGKAEGTTDNENMVGSAAMRPIFLGNLKPNYQAEDVIAIFHNPLDPPGSEPGAFKPIAVERLDQKRGYCFVFLKDAVTAEDKDNAERYVAAISGMPVPNVSSAVRAECARGDGRIKRKEDDRRKNIKPSDTLFVVNFQEETTKREDLKMLFEPFGELMRIDMKRNYAFVQFRNIEEATRAKEATNGGRLEQSVLTVEFVARERNRQNDGGGGGGEDDTEETTAAAAGTATIATATTGEETEAVDTEGETGVVPWTTEATAEETAITTTEAGEEEATDIATIADAETTFAEDATDRPTGEDLPGAAGSIAGAAAPGADRRRAAETTAGRTEEAAEATRETAVLLPAGAMTIATGVATKIIGAAATRTTSAGALRRPTAETIAAETIAVTVARESRDENKTKQNQNQTENDVRKVPVELHSFGGFVRNLSGNRATKKKERCALGALSFSLGARG